MNEMYIIAFNSTHNAIRTEKLLTENNIKVTTLPTPREISASCGISIRFLHDNIEQINQIISDNKIESKGIYRIYKTECGKRNVEQL